MEEVFAKCVFHKDRVVFFSPKTTERPAQTQLRISYFARFQGTSSSNFSQALRLGGPDLTNKEINHLESTKPFKLHYELHTN